MNLKLFHYWRSSASWRVRWGLEIKGVPVDYQAVDLLKGEEKQSTYHQVNPSGYLPSLVVDGKQVLGESLAILEWLEENYPKPSFFVGDSFDRARIRQAAESINSGIQPLQNLDVIRRLSDKKEVQDEWIRHWILRGLSVYESLIVSAGKVGKYSFGDSPSLADLCLIPQCYSAQRFQVDLSPFKNVKKIYEFALSTGECARSHPDRYQPKN